MTCDEEQDNNIKWLYDFIKRPLKTAVNYSPEKFSTGLNNSLKFDREKFFSLSGIECNIFSKQFYFHQNQINEKSVSYLKSQFVKDYFLIGYELSEQTRSILNQAKIKYIDIWLHPIRYMDDVLFGLKSNDPEVDSKLHSFNIPSETYYMYADRLKVQNYRGHRRSKANVKKDSALFIGQTLFDKAIFCNGKMLTLNDFKHEFEEITKKYSHVYYSRHPFVKEGDEEVLDYISRFRNVSINNDPAYHLLASDEIKYVFSISSSVVHEARYFDKDTNFLYKPVIEIGDKLNEYHSVMHEIFYSHFWEQVLTDKKTNEGKIEYFSGKDKTRDALSFYWGYRNIDKTESLKQTVSSLWDKSKKSENTSKTIIKKSDSIFTAIDKHKVISFDIFDTLITRKTFSPREIFNFVEVRFNSSSEQKISGFKQFRVIAENAAHQNAITNNKQECTFDEIYHQLEKLMGITHETALLLKELEVVVEVEYSIPRARGIELLEYAKKANKTIILTSDMYFTQHEILQLLKKNSIEGYKKIFVSSEIRLKKKTGDLFKFIENNLSVDFKEILHIGDNIDGDVKVPESLGIKTFRTPRSIDNAKFDNPKLKEWIDIVSTNKTPLLDSIITLISNKYHDNESSTRKSLFNGDKHEFGYKGFGPLIIGFTTWIRSQAIKNNIKTLYFLSRDTKVVFDSYNILYPEDKIKTKYIYSSRRSVKVPSIMTRNDILTEVYKTIYSTNISRWIESTFGLSKDNYSEQILIEKGLSGYEHPIGVKFSKEKLTDIVLEIEDKILATAESERENLIKYLNSEGLNTQDDIAVIDIGYAGTMQAAYQKLLNKKNIFGFYFATFNTALSNISDTSLINGYCLNLGSPNNSGHTISSHRFIYEALFCDADGSFIKPVRKEFGFEIIKSEFDDSVRQNIVKDIHNGVTELAMDLKTQMPNENLYLYIDPVVAGYGFDIFLKKPENNDISILSGILFEDAVAPNSRRYIVPPANLSKDDNVIKNMIWKEAAVFFIPKSDKAIAASPPKKDAEVLTAKNVKPQIKQEELELSSQAKVRVINFIETIERNLVPIFLRDKKKKKYLRNRDEFFIDSKNKVIEAYYKKMKM